ncbi:MAG: Na(+)-translocating NADH-quinone reductase subunit A [Alistipes sp.]|jgi:Na+-transporting NADH:ubiquinone oxidoreductase subunit A|nr:Na(+)-translocating NADH-quinone reductase subunit A [Alistipes sp.]
MSKIIKLRKGLDIHLEGEPAPKLIEACGSDTYAVSPPDFDGVMPKLLVREGDKVKAGSPLFFDKAHEEILFTSPVSGVVAEIRRGEKRKLLSVVVATDGKNESVEFKLPAAAKASKEDVAAVLLSAGLWPMLIQRPYGRIATPGEWPRAIFVSGFDSAPCAPDMNFVLAGELENLKTGVEVLKHLTDGKVHLGLKAGTDGVLNKVDNAEQHFFAGPHPAGNVGVQIHHIDPIRKGDVVWTVDVQNLAIIGRLFKTGRLDMTKTVCMSGPQVVNPYYLRIIGGAEIKSFVMNSNIKTPRKGGGVRIVSGNALTGRTVTRDEFMTFYSNQITVLEEGDYYELLGWIAPRFGKFSTSHSYFSWLCPRRKYRLDTNLNGGERAIVMTGIWERYLPMDIHPMYLVKACIAGNIDKMEALGIYEVLPEDLALCEFVDPSKTEIQEAVAQGINLMIKELS